MPRIERSLTRRKPEAAWTVGWYWRQSSRSANNHRTTIVKASYAADMESVIPDRPEGEDPTEIPNNITITLLHRDPDRVESMRLTREAALLLRDQLGDALAWDGQ